MCYCYTIYLRKIWVKRVKYRSRILEKLGMLLCRSDDIIRFSIALISSERSPKSVSSFLAIENLSSSSRCCNACDVVSSERTVSSWFSSSEMTSGIWPSLLSRSLGTTSSIASSRTPPPPPPSSQSSWCLFGQGMSLHCDQTLWSLWL